MHRRTPSKLFLGLKSVVSNQLSRKILAGINSDRSLGLSHHWLLVLLVISRLGCVELLVSVLPKPQIHCVLSVTSFSARRLVSADRNCCAQVQCFGLIRMRLPKILTGQAPIETNLNLILYNARKVPSVVISPSSALHLSRLRAITENTSQALSAEKFPDDRCCELESLISRM